MKVEGLLKVSESLFRMTCQERFGIPKFDCINRVPKR